MLGLIREIVNPMDRGAWWAAVHGVVKSRTRLSDFTFTFHSHASIQHNSGGPAAAAAKSLQSCLTLCDPIDGSLPGSPVPGILQARTLEWVAISFFALPSISCESLRA